MTTAKLRPALVAAALVGVAALAGSAVADAPGADTAAPAKGSDDPEIEFQRYKLENGLEVILHKDSSVPIAAVDVWYHVGSGDETPGKSGFAHLFEHMLFQGSEHVGSDRHFEILKSIGATEINGTTSTDRTNYYEVVPSHQLETALWLESDRMGYLLPTLTQKSLDNQIEVVRNERRQRIDNQPYGRAYLALYKALYPEGHPYRYTTIGRHEDLESATLEDVKSFYRKWYVPANATLLVAGDFEIAQAKALVDKWFGSFPKTTRPGHEVPQMPEIEESRRVTVEDPLAKLRQLDIAWHTPKFFGDGDAAMDVIGHVLGAEGTGRLYKILVHDKQLAQSVTARQASQGYSSVFMVSVKLKTGADLAEVEKIVNRELERVASEPISDEELSRAVVSFEARTMWGLESLLARAETLQRYNHFVGKPDYITKDLNRYRNATPETVKKAAADYLGDNQRVEILTKPVNADDKSGAGSKGGK